MKVGDNVKVDLSYGILVDAEIKRTNSGIPYFKKDYFIFSGFGDPVSIERIIPCFDSIVSSFSV